MIHIIFSAAGRGSLKVALRKMELEQAESIIALPDIFTIGPIWRLDDASGMMERWKWLDKNMRDEFNEHPIYTRHFEEALKQINAITEGDQVMIWAGENAHEQIGLRYVSFLLKNVAFSVINTTKVYDRLTRNDTIKSTFLHTGEMAPEELKKIYQTGEKSVPTVEERKRLEDDWLSLASSRATLRIWRNGEVRNAVENYYDAFIIEKAKVLEAAHHRFLITPRLIAEVITDLDDYIGDTFIEYRVRKLIQAGIFEAEGSLEAMRFYKVKLKE
ncbi:DUF1835 domain-containing protein [Ralstonia pickettii]|nr:DUF1835 domain-containing protein [Ralstonia pickettii]